MKALITGTVAALALSVSAAAQDSTVKTETKVGGDDARAVTLRGCLQQSPITSTYTLRGSIVATGEDLKAKTKVETDVDKDDTTVKSQSEAKLDHGDHSVGTSGTTSSYLVMPRAGVDLAAHAGEEVEISAVMIDARTDGDDDAELRIEDKTKVEREDAPDSKAETRTKVEVPRTGSAQLTAMSVKSLGRTCQ